MDNKSKEKSYHYDSSYQQQVKPSKSSAPKEIQTPASCLCCRPNRRNEGSCLQGLFSNLGICALLLGYTLLGSFVFLAIEGGGGSGGGTLFAGSTATPVDKLQNNRTLWLKKISDESRARTVENIWDITVSLNILYRDNWTRLAAQEITRFQEQLVARLTEEIGGEKGVGVGGQVKGIGGAQLTATSDDKAQLTSSGGVVAESGRPGTTALLQSRRPPPNEWNFARAFLYSLTVLTTIGYGNGGPRTSLGKAVTMGYAVIGIPLMLIYLSSVGALLSKCMRRIFARSLCCCFCSNCGYCCYDEKQMQDKERRMRKKRQQLELQQQQQQLQEPFYVRSASSNFTSASSTHNNLHSPARDDGKHNQTSAGSSLDEMSIQSPGHIIAPIILCLIVMMIYICIGAFVLARLEAWPFLDGTYFCFMSLSTIGFGDMLSTRERPPTVGSIWFCSLYILSGMALTAMCFNIIHDEIVHRLRHRVDRRDPT